MDKRHGSDHGGGTGAQANIPGHSVSRLLSEACRGLLAARSSHGRFPAPPRRCRPRGPAAGLRRTLCPSPPAAFTCRQDAQRKANQRHSLREVTVSNTPSRRPPRQDEQKGQLPQEKPEPLPCPARCGPSTTPVAVRRAGSLWRTERGPDVPETPLPPAAPAPRPPQHTPSPRHLLPSRLAL